MRALSSRIVASLLPGSSSNAGSRRPLLLVVAAGAAATLFESRLPPGAGTSLPGD